MQVKLGDICKIISSKRIFKNEYVPLGIPFIRGQEVSDRTIFDNSSYSCYISESRYNELKRDYVVPKRGDILITAVGTIGNLYYVNSDFKFYYKDGNLLQFTNFRKDIDSKYLFYFMHSDYFKKQLNNNLIGAVQKALTMVMLNKINIPEIDMASQQKIVKILSFIDNQIVRNKTMVKRLQVLAQSIYSYWFNQFEFPNDEGKPYRSSGGEMVWNKELKQFIPAKWSVKSLNEVSTLVLGGTPSRNIENYWKNGNINWLNSGEISNFPITTSEEKITLAGLENSATEYMKSGTIVISITGNIRASILGIDSCANQSVVGIIENETLKKEYLYPYMSALLNKFIRMSTGNCQQHINKKTLEEAQTLIPTGFVLNNYYNKLTGIYFTILKVALQTRKLESLKEKLLPLLMNGQLQ